MGFDVYGIGNPLMDISIQVDDEDLVAVGLKKGKMHLLELSKINDVLDQLNKKEILMSPAGDCANTMMGVANLGLSPAFCGSIGTDSYGKIYEEGLQARSVATDLVKKGMTTGRCVSLITPDSERTMMTHLGSAMLLDEKDINERHIKQSKYIYVTGYTLEEENLRRAALKAMKIAKDNNKKIVLDYADAHLIQRIKPVLIDISKRYADIVLCNHTEASEITGREPESAINLISAWTDTAVIKLGVKGSIVKQRDELIRIPSFKVKAVDTTGAGDGYAAGFMVGLLRGRSLKESASLGSLYASKIVEQVGSTLSKPIDIEEMQEVVLAVK